MHTYTVVYTTNIDGARHQATFDCASHAVIFAEHMDSMAHDISVWRGAERIEVTA